MKVLPDSANSLTGIAGLAGGIAIANFASLEYSEYPTTFFDLNINEYVLPLTIESFAVVSV